MNGKIALIQRGGATFNAKTKGALTAGAKAVVIYNCSVAAADPVPMMRWRLTLSENSPTVRQTIRPMSPLAVTVIS